ncbi:Integration host factor subunit beta [Enhygromyxa salina]|uniref:Integration host factor subunit beta n=1 Tax=Enhygromyxa salina TaxID=215803 RepID=A0A2S9XBB4_9BACT|nr:HU family DNA-binding protein [Enhygromyxa salina]PRP90149.1 Integration host factor subunit beta [Enhygromyxa salina]
MHPRGRAEWLSRVSRIQERTVTKSELIERVAQELGLTKGRAEMVVNTIFDSMTTALMAGDGIEIRGFGSFTVRQYKAYEGRNPRTGDVVHVAPKRLPFFKVGKELRERVNGRWVPEADAPQPPPTRAAPSSGPSKPPPPRRRDESLSEDVI